MASPSLLSPSSSKFKPVIGLFPIQCKYRRTTVTSIRAVAASSGSSGHDSSRREFFTASAMISGMMVLVQPITAMAASDEDYVRETEEVIGKVRNTVNMDKSDPNVASAVADLRDTSNSWVAKYRREKSLLGRASFRDIYSALNAISGHYISFGPTAPIPAKRKARILEEVDTAEKALLRGR